MDAVRRRHYLQALGIETWVRRDMAGSVVDTAESEKPGSVATALLKQPKTATPSLPTSGLAEPMLLTEEPMPRSRNRLPAIPSPLASPVIASSLAVQIPSDWAGLREMVRDCPRCKLCATRTQTVFGVGVENAPLLIVGEGPGADEDARGEPFVGRAGQLLDQMLLAIGRSRKTDTYIANVVKCRPPGNRDPEPDEVDACRPYLDRQIELIQPKLIVGLGRTAAQRLLQTDETLARLRGPLHHYGPNKTPVFITYHPAYLLRSPREKAKSWQDLKRIHQILKGA